MKGKVHSQYLQRGCTYAINCQYTEFHDVYTYTDDVKKVTCAVCLKQIKKHNLQSKKDFPEVPKFRAEFKPGGGRSVKGFAIFTCPVCGQIIQHGWGSGPRTSHCACWEEYELICQDSE